MDAGDLGGRYSGASPIDEKYVSMVVAVVSNGWLILQPSGELFIASLWVSATMIPSPIIDSIITRGLVDGGGNSSKGLKNVLLTGRGR
jgi:hypothetical protein